MCTSPVKYWFTIYNRSLSVYVWMCTVTEVCTAGIQQFFSLWYCIYFLFNLYLWTRKAPSRLSLPHAVPQICHGLIITACLPHKYNLNKKLNASFYSTSAVLTSVTVQEQTKKKNRNAATFRRRRVRIIGEEMDREEWS